MEKIRVNMTPCEEVKTIHASQDDNATRKWAFDLYDENGKIDSSDIKEQMIFDSRVGGTEQILPENTSNPITSPIIADIQYPDSLRSEQIFLYRESPTQRDGQAKITRIKGNTVVFNQLIQNGNFADTSGWVVSTASFTVNNNIATVTPTAQWGGIYIGIPNFTIGHKYFVKIEYKKTTANADLFFQFSSTRFTLKNSTNWEEISEIVVPTTSRYTLTLTDARTSGWDSYMLKNIMVIDLTQLNNSAITDAPSFRSRFNLPYYGYTTGKLLPFKGESLKTTGKNLCPPLQLNGAYLTSGQFTLLAGTYNISIKTKNYGIAYWMNGDYVSDKNTHTVTANSSGSFSFTVSQTSIVSVGARHNPADGTISISDIEEPMIRLSTTTSDYSPYTTSTLSLPISTYFPTGMKSAGSVYDEITESKAITRVGSVDLGTLTWSVELAQYNTFSANISDMRSYSNIADNVNFSSSMYHVNPVAQASMDNLGLRQRDANNTIIVVKNTAYTDVTAFKNAMSGQYLYFELATPTEEPITTASLVTEKGEAPLYYDDELIADCNETISSESGIFDAKIKLMDDNTIYSQKIQFHVERKP